MEKITNLFKKIWKSACGFTRKAYSAVREELSRLHVAKRATMPVWKSLSIRVCAVVLAIIFCALLSVFMIDANPIDFIATMFKGAFGTTTKLWVFAKNTAVLLIISLAVTPAFRMKFWNIGAEGQTLMGALASVAVAHYLGGKVHEAVLLVLMFLFAMLVGSVWGGAPAVCKAAFGTNETLFTLMMNYVASGLVAYFLLLWTPNGSSVLPRLEHGIMPVVIHRYFITIALSLIFATIVYIYLQYSKHGYEISVVGESENTAKYIGINVGKVIIRTMLISGAICGIAGFILVSCIDNSVSTTTVGGLGFTAIMVSWLAKFNPFIMIGSSAFITFLDQGSNEITTVFNVDSSFPDVVVGIVLFFIIGCEFFINYSIKRREAKKEVNGK